MSTVIRSCPGCKTLLLSDTAQCPECGHVFYERRDSVISAVVDVGSMQTASLLDPCPHCGELVRTELVRCRNCNGFMREDIAARYRDMTGNPQQIIYSTIPLEQRTDFLPARSNTSGGAIPKAYDADDFELSDGVGGTGAESAQAEFELNTGSPDFGRQVSLPQAATQGTSQTTAAPVDGPDKPQTKTPGGKPITAEKSHIADSASAETSSAPAEKSSANDEDLLSIAMQEEREVSKRRGEKVAERQRKQMLLHCTCGAWIRVSEDQAGKVVRCRQCKQSVNVPPIRRKVEKKEDKPNSVRHFDRS